MTLALELIPAILCLLAFSCWLTISYRRAQELRRHADELRFYLDNNTDHWNEE